jgi:hypothetical protein
MKISHSQHVWRFIRCGSLDQVILQNDEDLLNLKDLDPKLWVALSCPVKGLEIDEHTLELMDIDGDGRIRIPEILNAIEWLYLRLKSVSMILNPKSAIYLADLREETPEGQSVRTAAEQIIGSRGWSNTDPIPLEALFNLEPMFKGTRFNGDGIISSVSSADAELSQLIVEMIQWSGGVADRSGEVGVDAARIDRFFDALRTRRDWVIEGAREGLAFLGEQSKSALDAFFKVEKKIDDYFARCELGQFDERALQALNRQEADFYALAAQDLEIEHHEIVRFPISKVHNASILNLVKGINPAWKASMAEFYSAVIVPLFGEGKTMLTLGEWEVLKSKTSQYKAWLESEQHPDLAAYNLDRIETLLASSAQQALHQLIAEDTAVASGVSDLLDIRKLAFFYRDMKCLMNNFINFSDFYDKEKWAVFQQGTLYLDGRSCELCIRVENPAAHAVIAAMSRILIVYCDLKAAKGETMKIAACITQGDSDFLHVGRNGVFVDRNGKDWDATVTKILDNPISIRQAFWSPYKKFIRRMEESAAKRAAAADTQNDAMLDNLAKNATSQKDKPAPVAKMDVGTVAALGVGASALIAVITSLIGGILGLDWWQIPLAAIGVLLVISGPSMIVAALKLRQRNLAPILDANGWAINGRVKINIPLATSLTDRRKLPDNARLNLRDPFAEKANLRLKILLVILCLTSLAAVVLWSLSICGSGCPITW